MSCSVLPELTGANLPKWIPETTIADAGWIEPSPTVEPGPPPKNDFYLARDGSEAVVKLELPGAPFKDSDKKSVQGPGAVILQFKISPNGRHLILNNYYHVALSLENPSIPPEIVAPQVGANLTMDDLLYARERIGAPVIHPVQNLLLDYEFDMNSRDDPSIRYGNHHPKFKLNLIGAGSYTTYPNTANFLLDDPSQKMVQIEMKERNNLHSQHPDRNYTITGVNFLSRPEGYKGPHPQDAKTCSLLSWRCADLGDPPYYVRVWRFQFDEYGRIGSLRRACLRSWDILRPILLFVLCPAWCIMLAWKAVRALWRRGRVDVNKPLPLLPFEQRKRSAELKP